MLYHEQSEDYRPLFWMQGRPIYANTLIIIIHVAAFVISALCIAYFGFDAVTNLLALRTQDSHDIWHGQIWRLISYVTFDLNFFAQGSGSSGAIWFLICILMLYFFGREVEQLVGRRTYLKFYAALILIPALIFSLLGLVIPLSPYLNCGDVIFGVFVAFATIYPGAMPSFWIPLSARALKWILLALFTLIYVALHDISAIIMLWSCAVVAYVSMRLVGAGHGTNWFVNWLENRRTQRLARQHNFKVVQDKKSTESIDAILEKISKHGVGSLDARERAALEQARTKLLKRDKS